ncbi:MAG: hypothetical protein MPJ52_04085, partial [Alphaproteobacteria bacterium]|nr:hypothetical protein [Alphaproteobacteria bacterium]MDA7987900.1 hypothetical protein [Alphaproteobacteria bacterium]
VNVSDDGDGDGAVNVANDDTVNVNGDNNGGAVNVPFGVPFNVSAGDNDNTVNVSDDGDNDGAVNVANDDNVNVANDGVVNFPPASGGANGVKPGELTIRTPQDHGLKSGTLIPGMRQQNELPGEQRMEDTLCTCFDTAPASEDADLLGTPILEFTFSADKPVALVTVRLCEVAPDGSSERILWRAFNLTHHPALNAMDGDTGYNGLNGREYEKALEPGEQYRVRLPLGVIARTITRGNRLRLALATTYWPMEWPAPEAFTLKIAPSLCRLTLPLRRPRAQDEITMPAPRDEITSRWRKLEDGESTRITGADKEGRTQVEWNDKFPTLQSEDHHLVIAQEVSETYLVGDDPASAEIVVRWTTRNAREKEFETRVESWHRMTCDTRNFRLRAGFNAFLNGRKFHSREWDETIPRELL